MDHSISRYGISDALLAEFSMLREVQTVSGIPKYTRKSVDTLAQMLVCRNYGNTCFEFAHLCWVIIHRAGVGNNRSLKYSSLKRRPGSPLLEYFWISQVASKTVFVEYFAGDMQSSLSSLENDIKDNQVVFDLREDGSMRYSMRAGKLDLLINGHEFTLHGDRANFWACISEWLVCVSPDLLEFIERTLENKGQNAINELASRLQQEIYSYLTEHLPPAKLQRRFRQIDTWHQANTCKNSDASQSFDEPILQFWQAHNQLEGYTKYSFVVSEHLAYMQAKDIVHTQAKISFSDSIEEAQHKISADKALLDWHLEEGANESFHSIFSQHQHDKFVDVDMLNNKPKVFKQEHLYLLELVVDYPQRLQSVLRSWLRSMVFAKYQNQLIQAKRKNKVINIENIEAEPRNYGQVCSQTSKLIAHNQFTLLALVDILLGMSPKDGLFLLAKLSAQLPSFKEHSPRFKELFGEDDVFDDTTIPTAKLKHPWFNAMLKQCKQARSRINRVGFTENTMLSEDEYLDAASQLLALNKLLIKMLNNISQQNLQSEEIFCSDRLIFIDKLRALYSKDSERNEKV